MVLDLNQGCPEFTSVAFLVGTGKIEGKVGEEDEKIKDQKKERSTS